LALARRSAKGWYSSSAQADKGLLEGRGRAGASIGAPAAVYDRKSRFAGRRSRTRGKRDGTLHRAVLRALSKAVAVDGRVGPPSGSLSRPPLNGSIVSRTDGVDLVWGIDHT